MKLLHHAILVLDKGCNTSLTSAKSSKAHFAILHSCLKLCSPQSLNMHIYMPHICKAYSAHAYTQYIVQIYLFVIPGTTHDHVRVQCSPYFIISVITMSHICKEVDKSISHSMSTFENRAQPCIYIFISRFSSSTIFRFCLILPPLFQSTVVIPLFL